MAALAYGTSDFAAGLAGRRFASGPVTGVVGICPPWPLRAGHNTESNDARSRYCYGLEPVNIARLLRLDAPPGVRASRGRFGAIAASKLPA